LQIGNVRAALQWAFSADGDVNVGVELAISAAPLFIGLSLLEEWTPLPVAPGRR
jgi:predicted ATPase